MSILFLMKYLAWLSFNCGSLKKLQGHHISWAMQVGFGDVWKQSLSELSGGQRSLLALSLILAMLLFKPAPIYILDEVCLVLLLMDNAV